MELPFSGSALTGTDVTDLPPYPLLSKISSQIISHEIISQKNNHLDEVYSFRTATGESIQPRLALAYFWTYTRNRVLALRLALLPFLNDTGSLSHSSWYTLAYSAAIFTRVVGSSCNNCSCIQSRSASQYCSGITVLICLFTHTSDGLCVQD